MGTAKLVLEALVVLGAIAMGVRTGGIGLGLWGAFGTALLVFGFGLDPGSPPVDAFFIIIAVITASSAMQAAGGIDYLVSVASRIIRRNPRRITVIAPLVSFVFTVGAGTSNIFFALIPVIYETAFRNGVRPERPLAASTVCSGLGITASPVSAAMAAYLTLMPGGFTLSKVLLITLPAGLVATVVTSLVQNRVGKELADDPEFRRRVAAGECEPVPVAAARAGTGGGTAAEPGDAEPEPPLRAGAARSTGIFLSGVAVIVAMGLFDRLRPLVTVGGKSERLGMTICIELVMFTVALAILLANRVPAADVVRQPLMSSGIIAAVALFGVAWMADTFISGNAKQIIDPLADIAKEHSLFLAVALFVMCGLTTSQSATTRAIVPIGLAALPAATVTAMWPSLVGVWLFPANGTQIAAVQIDRTGTTRLSHLIVWHSFTIPMLVSWVSVVGVGLVLSRFVA
ncbi:anaerobic C4-dicarboxylate transporter family protein [Longispora sp. NPDC051575]|uniref:anaerobic C4-dicarboxylate transporter family protein n=1 Tax=Longispora sp. NPDC051575 TaxID=3154943 RepID=UPI00343AC810